MNWNEFLKPTANKLAVSILIFFFVPFYFGEECMVSVGEAGGCSPFFYQFYRFLTQPYFNFLNPALYLFAIPYFVLSYILSCLLVFLIKRYAPAFSVKHSRTAASR
jgi:hypothetical protein